MKGKPFADLNGAFTFVDHYQVHQILQDSKVTKLRSGEKDNQRVAMGSLDRKINVSRCRIKPWLKVLLLSVTGNLPEVGESDV